MLHRLMLSVLQIALAVALGLPLALWAFQDKLIFHPQPIDPARVAALQRALPELHSWWLDTPDGRQHAWFLPAHNSAATSQALPVVIYFGGNAEEVSWLMQETAQVPEERFWHWLFIDYRGFAQSAGAPSQKTLVVDAVQWFDRAALHASIDKSRIMAVGRSLGSGVAVQLAAARPLARVALITPFDSLTAVAQFHYPIIPVRWLLRHPFDSLELAPQRTMPLLVLAGERDTLIPPEHAKRLHDAWGGAKSWHLLDRADHNNISGHPQFVQVLRRFLTVGAFESSRSSN